MDSRIVYFVALAIAVVVAIALRGQIDVMVGHWGWPFFTRHLISIAAITIIMVSVQAMARKLGWVREQNA
jgi:hypothetical protein